MEDKNHDKNVAEFIVDTLANAGVQHLYGITGDSLNALTDAISKDGRIKFIHVRHEESAAFAASAEAQLTGKLAVCAGSSGPGHVHLVNGLYDANRTFAPVLAIASTCPSAMFGTEYFQETKPELLFENCSIYNQMAVSPAQVPVMFQNAMQQALSRGGVAVVAVPGDVNAMPVPSEAAATPLITDRLPTPSKEEISKCAEIINNAGNITIFAGSGASKAADKLSSLAERLKAPLITTFKSQLELTKDSPNYVGHIGYLGMWSATDALQRADAIIVIGTNFPYSGLFPEGKKIIQVDVRPENIGKRMTVNIGVRADAGLFIDAISPFIQEKTDRTHLDKALADYAEICNKMQEPVKHPGTVGSIRPEFVFDTLDRLADVDAIFTVDTGMNCLWSAHYLHPSKGRTMIGSFSHGSMANALPQAIGASVTCPERQVIALCGDGGLTMLMGDLLTIIQYRLPVKILVADNRSLAFVKWEMELAGFKPSEVSLKNPDFGDMARSIGFDAQTIDNPEHLEEAMKHWLEATGPALLSVVTDDNAASFTFSHKLMDASSPDNNVSNFMPPGI